MNGRSSPEFCNMRSAETASFASSVRPKAQPITRGENASTTTAKQVAESAQPAVATYLRATDLRADQMFAAIEECLRFETPLPSIGRVASRDVEIGGQLIRKGDRVVLFYGSGNRDGSMFERPVRHVVVHLGERRVRCAAG